MSLKYIESSLRGVQHAGAWSLGGGRTCAHLVCSNQTHKLVITTAPATSDPCNHLQLSMPEIFVKKEGICVV
jgi:hypothetical protein